MENRKPTIAIIGYGRQFKNPCKYFSDLGFWCVRVSSEQEAKGKSFDKLFNNYRRLQPHEKRKFEKIVNGLKNRMKTISS